MGSANRTLVWLDLLRVHGIAKSFCPMLAMNFSYAVCPLSIQLEYVYEYIDCRVRLILDGLLWPVFRNSFRELSKYLNAYTNTFSHIRSECDSILPQIVCTYTIEVTINSSTLMSSNGFARTHGQHVAYWHRRTRFSPFSPE